MPPEDDKPRKAPRKDAAEQPRNYPTTAAEAYQSAMSKLEACNKRLLNAYSQQNYEVCQTLGKVLGYPWLKDDQKNFPGSTEADGVCVGEHVAESIAEEAAKKITELQSMIEQYSAKSYIT